MSALSSTLPTPRPQTPTSIDPRLITDPLQITAQLALLSKRESDLTLALNSLVADRSQIDGAVTHLRELGSEVGHLLAEVEGTHGGSSTGLGLTNGDVFLDGGEEGLVERVRRVWETSERVGGKVRKLDEEVSRVREATDIVTEVLELKNALQTLSSAIAKSDWESASRACRRAMQVRKEVIEGGFAGAVVPTPQQPQPPPQMLEELRDILLHTFRTEFDSAAERKDEQAVSRFFRLWPGIEAEEEGLEAYGDFVVELVKARSANTGKPSSPLYYLTSLTSLLESIAHIIDQHQPVVDKYYGKGRMKKVVGRLVGESDRVVRNLVEGWEEERRVGRLISDTKQAKFPLLYNPALLPLLFPSLVNLSGGQLSLASLNPTSHLPNLQTASHLLQTYAQGSKRPTPGLATPALEEEPNGPDPRDVDRVLGELVALGGRWSLFRRFVWGRTIEEEDDADEPPKQQNGESSDHDEEQINGSPTPKDVGLDILDNSGSQKAIENLLRVYYEPLELFYLRTSIEKAHRLDSPDTSSKPHISSILDDTFYLLKLVIRRVLSAGNLPTLRSMRLKVSDVVERDYIGVIRKKMDGVYSLPAPERGGEKVREREQRSAFIIYLNDLDVSADYMERLIDEIQHSLPQVFLDVELGAVKDELDALSDLANLFRNQSKAGLEQFFNQLTRPRLRSLLDDVYKDTTYVLDEESFALAEEDDSVRRRFARAWEGLIDGYRDAFTDHNYQSFFNLTVEVLVRPWEKMILNMRFTELGAIRYDRDVRAVANYLSGQTNFGGAREKFTRLMQIGTVLNMDAEEDAEDFWSNSGIPWRLSKAEYNGILEQRQ
ncbi:COG4 transport protein-domain-containing protein [Naematelia encephala]|uniref:Conserved oligomeric Golgi complex subunit 4 n=1 Tax=Naematelia encephala TaxID=71784 RepID=A0A1Y2BFX0_9TREE|nr:COG4 transport protein-domain-containing protein [Naematelia encephala]